MGYTAKEYRKLKLRNKKKIFCIGMNKTGTTSLEKAFKDLGFITGNQRRAELLLTDYINGNFNKIIDYCKTAEVFQDFPFSFPETYKYLDEAFPGSKFILSLRGNAEEWYASLTGFHARMFGNGKIPSANDLKNANYINKGWAWKAVNILFHSPDDDPYNKEMLIKKYNDYNTEVINYFSGRSEDLLVLNLADKTAYKKFCIFLKIDSPFYDFPWQNKTENINR